MPKVWGLRCSGRRSVEMPSRSFADASKSLVTPPTLLQARPLARSPPAARSAAHFRPTSRFRGILRPLFSRRYYTKHALADTMRKICPPRHALLSVSAGFAQSRARELALRLRVDMRNISDLGKRLAGKLTTLGDHNSCPMFGLAKCTKHALTDRFSPFCPPRHVLLSANAGFAAESRGAAPGSALRHAGRILRVVTLGSR